MASCGRLLIGLLATQRKLQKPIDNLIDNRPQLNKLPHLPN
jgi:hypothetical protein